MTHHFTYFDWIIGGFAHAADVQKFLLGIAIGLILIVAGLASKSRLTPAGMSGAIVPESRISLFSLLDFLIEKLVAYHDSVLGRENRRFVPFVGTLFIFIFISNLVGLFPGMPAVTTTVWINVGMALCVFVYFNYYGIKTHGALNYFKHFCGPGGFVAVMLLPIELLSTCLRVLTLNLRLYWNITADHLVLGIMTDLTKVIVPVIFYALGTFVSFMQAFVFTTLTMIYLLQATQHVGDH